MVLEENLKALRERVSACEQNVVLIAATKTQTKETVDEFMSIASDFVLGENRVQELVDKFDERYTWHFIGRLQTNKVKYIVGKVALIHSLDRIELADEIEKQAKKHNLVQDCLVEVNMGGELSKGGVEPDKLLEFVDSLKNYEHLRILGIMSVLPNLEDKAALEGEYQKLQQLYQQLKTKKQANLDVKYLSAGMTNDFDIALKYGSNMIRIGRLLFGERAAK
ncbi:MAG: YggS family pyridoxal phosphate-dependent enzyme [Clostridia bacterium]|nr:YggS family pyridoxal phosphate-dependent enzyme [Clostridia bacterium]